jgi:hypothetical protein
LDLKKETMKHCLVDSSSAILFHKSGLFLMLTEAYRVVLTASVYRELTVAGYPGAGDFVEYGTADLVRILNPPANRWARGKTDDDILALDAGERDTILCYRETPGLSFIVLDDGRAARYCRQRKIPYINAILFTRIAYLAGMLTVKDYRGKYEKLSAIGRYSEEIMAYARHSSRKDIAHFLP